MKIFLNGVEESSLNVSGSIDQNSTPVNIARSRPSQNNYSSYRFSGEIDNVSMWSRSLPSQEIHSKIFSNNIGTEEGLVGYWTFNEGEGNTLTDLSGNGNDGTINGAMWSGDHPVPPVFGCTDPNSVNYDPNANVDDGSCSYPYNGEYSLYFDGSDDYLSIPSTPDLIFPTADFTFEFWVYYTSSSSGKGIFNHSSSVYNFTHGADTVSYTHLTLPTKA